MRSRLSSRLDELEQNADRGLSDDLRAWLGEIPDRPVEPARAVERGEPPRLNPSMLEWLRQRS